jgi:deoxyadenosine/deoxycytidine kinase
MYLVIAGNIGAGKTSLAQMISRELGFSVYFEAFGENPFLPSYYQDMRRWAFATQISFLALRYEQILNHVLMSDVPAILDRSIYEDREIFAKALVRDGLLSLDEWNTYDKLYQLMVRRLPNPNLLVYLRRDVPALLANIRKRNRSIENISGDYLEGLNKQYEEFYGNWHYPKVVFEEDIFDHATDVLQLIKSSLLY